VGSWQAVEAVKLLLGIGRPATAGMLVAIDTMTPSVSTHPVEKDPDCPACGKSPRILPPLSPAHYSLDRSCAL
jgi:bacteriocin biosynthesis cyclodehydratase domain-containing protein